MTERPEETMSDTPRTDPMECEIFPSADPNYDGPSRWVEAHFARTLERELSASAAALARVTEERDEARVWPDDLQAGVEHALEIASLHSGLPQALAAIQAEIDRNCAVPGRPYECFHCGAVREFSATRLVEAQDDALRLHREKLEQWERAESAESRVAEQAARITELTEIVIALQYYGHIYAVTGVALPDGSHQEWLDRSTRALSGKQTGGSDET